MATAQDSIELLIDLAARQTDVRARELAQALKRETSEDARLVMLADYRRGLLATLAESQRRGTSSGALQNYTTFLDRLDAAIAQQQAAVDRAKGHSEAARSGLNAAERKRKSLETLLDRRIEGERRKENRREQKQHDEISTRISVHGRGGIPAGD